MNQGLIDHDLELYLVVCKPLLGIVAVFVVAKVVEARAILPALQRPTQDISESGLPIAQALDPLPHAIRLSELSDTGIEVQHQVVPGPVDEGRDADRGDDGRHK